PVPTLGPVLSDTPPPCPAALLEGKIVAHEEWGVAVEDQVGGMVWQVFWPYGYTARVVEGRVTLLDEAGDVVAGEGDVVSVGGGEIGSTGAWRGCDGVTAIENAKPML
ncbi:MAG: hypothetical protein M3253_06370, partial [Chloroflexota bacterium]|nr:hypothetical protein [Chloroflexota bacterium]